jgi:hypothetical protein
MRLKLGAAAAGVLLILAAVIPFSLAAHPVVAGSNGIQPYSGTVFLKGGVRYCQQAPHLPADVSRLKMLVTKASGGAKALEVLVVDRRGRIASGTVSQVRAGYIAVRLNKPTPKSGIPHAGICFTNPGTGEIVLAGETKRCTPRDLNIGPAAPCATTPGLDGEYRWLVGVRYLRSGSASWLSQAGVILDRFGFAQAGWFGTWALWLAGAVAALAVALAFWWLIREPRANEPRTNP